jgi:hypothetical protein
MSLATPIQLPLDGRLGGNVRQLPLGGMLQSNVGYEAIESPYDTSASYPE